MEEQKANAVDEDWLEHRMQQLDALAAEIKQAEQELAESREAQQTKSEQLERRRARLVAKQARLEQEREILDARRQHTRTQRRRIAGWLNAERKALQLERAEFQQESKRLRQQLERKLARLNREAKRMSQAEQLDDSEAREMPADEKFPALRDAERVQWVSERSFLESRIEELEQQLMEAQQSSTAEAGANEEQVAQDNELQRRYEMAMDDVRELKQRNAELEESLTKMQSELPSQTPTPPGEDWEATKRRLLSELDDEVHPAKKLSAEDRLTAEGAIRITDSIVAQRDEEIADLKRQLARLQMNQGDVGPQSATDRVLEQDEVIRQERERLAALKIELKEKLRQAEIEISVQRATIARQRSELQEKARVLETERQNLELQRSGGSDAAPDRSKKQPRRWLERLGLKEADE